MAVSHGIAQVNGAALAYDVAGDGPAVVILHGLTLDRRMWRDQFDVFAARFRVVAYDLRGFGASSVPDAGVAYSHADDLHALLEELGIARSALVGLSLGGQVVQEFALRYPDAVDALVLVDSSLRGHEFSPAFGRTLGSLFGLAREGRLAEAKAEWLADPLFARSRALPDVAAQLERIVGEYAGWGLRHDDPHRPLDPPTQERLGEITAPTLVVVGAADIPDFHAVADRLAAGIPGARKAVLPGAGHMANMDAPAAFNRLVLEFLTRHLLEKRHK
jgi:pimeloyl-ACP methyl ester carboxylesterase